MVYRTRTYIAADWDNDSNAVQQLNYWNDNKYFSLHLLMLMTYSKREIAVLIAV